MSRLEEIKARVDAATGIPEFGLSDYLPETSEALTRSLFDEVKAWMRAAGADVPYLLAVIESQAKEIEMLRIAVALDSFLKKSYVNEADAIAIARQELE